MSGHMDSPPPMEEQMLYLLKENRKFREDLTDLMAERDKIEQYAVEQYDRAEKAEALLNRARALVSDWQANGNSRDLGDPTDRVWHEAARQLLTTLDGGDA